MIAAATLSPFFVAASVNVDRTFKNLIFWKKKQMYFGLPKVFIR